MNGKLDLLLGIAGVLMALIMLILSPDLWGGTLIILLMGLVFLICGIRNKVE
ncbi:hypothetical protein [Staphylococcus muscae]|uniref:Uncharacterized protein n=1 Tax=Staphylococcus muscae TaxID=1294 RepID=A0ABQ1HJ90_9STAP|nr:hypothetical protein [Staphylococcus muscae]GGA80371.1 hypothetical protein GCM10007183_00620 [Staphylococcus muscae]